MSNEMTDARAIEVVRDNLPPYYPASPLAAAFQHIAARLRGEAAQGEQQAVARVQKAPGPHGQLYAMLLPEGPLGLRVQEGDALYTRPQPAAVAGDAVQRALDAIQFDEHGQQVTVIGEAARSRLEAALSAAPAAPETDAVLIGQAVCYGDSDGGGDWFKELTVEGVTFLAPLHDHERAIHILAAKKRRKQQAAPAPVAGDAVTEIVKDLRHSAKVGDYEVAQIAFLESIADRLAALAQDRAAQPAIDEDLAFSTWLVQFCSTRTGDDRDAASDMRAAWKARASQGAAAGVLEGWRLVPEKSTDAMHRAYTRAKYEGPQPVLISHLYAAMLAAAPSAPSQGAEREVG